MLVALPVWLMAKTSIPPVKVDVAELETLRSPEILRLVVVALVVVALVAIKLVTPSIVVM